MLMHQCWSYLDGALDSRKYLCLAYLARDASPIVVCVLRSGLHIYVNAASAVYFTNGATSRHI